MSCGTCVGFQLSSYRRILYPRKLNSILSSDTFLECSSWKGRVTVDSLDKFPPTEPNVPLLSWNATSFLGGKSSGILYYFQKQVDQIFLVLSAFYRKNKFVKLMRKKLHFLVIVSFENQCRIQVRQNHSEDVLWVPNSSLQSFLPLPSSSEALLHCFQNFLFLNVLAICFLAVL